MNEYITLDLETTGFSVQTSEIIEISAWHIKGGVAVDRFNTFVKPVMYIPAHIQNITGIDMNMVKNSEPIETVLIEFFDWCEDYPFLGYNLQFDADFLLNKGKALGVDFSLGGTRTGIDVLALARTMLILDNYKLETVVDHLGINFGEKKQFHHAIYDSYVTKLVYERLYFMNPSYPGVKTPSLVYKNASKYGKAVDTGTLDFE